VDVNWGIRFGAETEVKAFVERLVGELGQRLQKTRLQGKQLTIKIKKRQPGAPSPRKFLGHGIVDNLSRSFTFSDAIGEESKERILEETWKMYKQLNVLPEDLRGFGIHLLNLSSKLTTTNPIPTSHQRTGFNQSTKSRNGAEDAWSPEEGDQEAEWTLGRPKKKKRQITLSPFVAKEKRGDKGKEEDTGESEDEEAPRRTVIEILESPKEIKKSVSLLDPILPSPSQLDHSGEFTSRLFLLLKHLIFLTFFFSSFLIFFKNQWWTNCQTISERK
jgi:hypothetical protein